MVQPIGWDAPYAERIVLCPARLELENRMSEAGVVGSHRWLAKALDGADEAFDYTLIDCPPGPGRAPRPGRGWSRCAAWCARAPIRPP